MEEELFVLDEIDHIAKILDAKYKLANLRELTANLPQPTTNQQQHLCDCLNDHAVLFDGTLGLWKGDPYKIELWDSVQPHHVKPYRVPQVYEKTFKQEVVWLCDIGVLRQINWSEWATPTFLIPKKD